MTHFRAGDYFGTFEFLSECLLGRNSRNAIRVIIEATISGKGGGESGVEGGSCVFARSAVMYIVLKLADQCWRNIFNAVATQLDALLFGA